MPEKAINLIKEKIIKEYAPENLTFVGESNAFYKFKGFINDIEKEFNYDKLYNVIILVED